MPWLAGLETWQRRAQLRHDGRRQHHHRVRVNAVGRPRSPRPNILRIDLSGGGIKSHQPVLAELRRRHGEPDWLCVGVEEQQEMVVGDRSTEGIEFRDGVTVEEDHQAAGESGIPIGLVHL